MSGGRRAAWYLAGMPADVPPKDFAALDHDLRTPLNAVIGFSQLLLWDERTPLTEQQKEMVAHILKGGEDLLELLDAWADSHGT